MTRLAKLALASALTIAAAGAAFAESAHRLAIHVDENDPAVMNLALNETLSRTVLPSGTTLIALVALLLLGGPVTWGFAFAVIFGVLSGTYSSIWVASAIVLRLGVKRDWSKPGGGAAGTKFANVDA